MPRSIVYTVVFGFLLCPIVSSARTIDVPGEYTTVGAAIGVAAAGDTVLVHPGVYPERLIFPAYDLLVASEYLSSGDTSAITATILDASAYAAADTGSVLTLVYGNTRATRVVGLTLTGGHGKRSPNPGDSRRWGGCFYVKDSGVSIESCFIRGNTCSNECAGYVDASSVTVSHCDISDNCGGNGVLGFWYNVMLDQSIVEWNEIHGNYQCGSTYPSVLNNGMTATYANIAIRFNRFHDFTGFYHIGLELYGTRAEVTGNVFERLTAEPYAILVETNRYANPITDNVFRDCTLGAGTAIMLTHSGHPSNLDRSPVQRNWFENIVATTNPSAVYMQEPNSEFTDNVFMACSSHVGTVQLSQNPPQGCDVDVARNAFLFNVIMAGHRIGSAFRSVGGGHACTVSDNWFEGNNAIAVDYDLEPDTGGYDMTNNYWGDPSGPYHPIENPEGRGDTVDAEIHVTPWLTEPPQSAPDLRERLRLKPDEWSLELPYPNPFNATTTIRLISQKPQPLEVSVYNTLGQRVGTIWRGVLAKDTPTQVRWDGRDERAVSVASGVYYIVARPKGSFATAPKTVKALLLR